MALIDEVKGVCDRLAPLGWRDLLLAASRGACDIAQSTNARLKSALEAPVTVDDTLSGFEDFEAAGACGIVAGQPARSLLDHALASPPFCRRTGMDQTCSVAVTLTSKATRGKTGKAAK